MRNRCGARLTLDQGERRANIAVDAFYSAKIQLTSWRALPSVMATAFGGIDRPLTLPFQ
jgi:hypothetical protein